MIETVWYFVRLDLLAIMQEHSSGEIYLHIELEDKQDLLDEEFILIGDL